MWAYYAIWCMGVIYYALKLLLCVFIHVDPLPFPDQLSSYGLTIELLSQAIDSA